MSDQEKQDSTNWIASILTITVIIVGIAIISSKPEQGEKGGKCNSDGSCNMGLVCKSQECEVIPKGALRGECRPNGGCNEGLVCNIYNFCVLKQDEKKPVPKNRYSDGFINKAVRGIGAAWRSFAN